MVSSLTVADIEFHDAANIFPLDEEHIAELAIDIQKHGQQQPIELIDGKILDGRRRYMACEAAGVEPKFKTVNPADPVAYVLSLNLHRRHLTPSQLSMVAARVRDIYDEQAKERQSAGQQSGGRGNKKNSVANFPPSNTAPGKARDKAGAAVGVSGKTVDHATKVLKQAIPEVVKAVDEGRMAVSTAAILSAEPPEVQREEIADHLKRLGPKKYTTLPKKDKDEAPEEKPEGERRGKGVILANEAINCLSRIPKNDALRKRGFQIVMDWIKANK
jgi:hypothetical protein